MVQTLQARAIDLRHLIDHFKLELAQDELLNQTNGLYDVFRILKRISQL